MKIKMLENKLAANDGIRVLEYIKGNVYSSPCDISEKIAKAFVGEKWAIDLEAQITFKPYAENKIENPAKKRKR